MLSSFDSVLYLQIINEYNFFLWNILDHTPFAVMSSTAIADSGGFAAKKNSLEEKRGEQS